MVPLTILKALADESRLSIFRLLLDRDAYIEVISERLKLAPSTVSFHLKKLNDAGLVNFYRDQYYTIYSAVPKIAERSLKDLILSSESTLQEQDEVEKIYKEKVLKSFFKYGKLVKIPSQKMKRHWVMERISKSFQSNKQYTLSAVDKILAEIYEDPASILRELITSDFLEIVDGKYKLKSVS